MADKSKPYNVKAALDDFHSPDSIAAAIRRSGRPVDSTGVAPHIMRRIMRDIPHVPEAANGPFGTARPPLATDVGMQRPQYTPPGQAQRSYPAPTVAADATASVPPAPRAPQNAYGSFSALGSMLGGASSLAAGPAAPLAAIPLSGLGAAAGKGLDYAMNAAEGTEYAPKSAGEVIHGMSGEGLLGMGTELFAAPLGAAAPAVSKWAGKKAIRMATGSGDEAADAITRLGVNATRGGEKSLQGHLTNLNAAAEKLVAEADAAAGAPQHGCGEVRSPVMQRWLRQLNNPITSKPKSAFARIWLERMGKFGYDKPMTYADLLEAKRLADGLVNWNALQRTAKSAGQEMFTQEEEEAAKAVADNLRGILSREVKGQATVAGLPKARPMSLSEIHSLEGGAMDASRSIRATFEPRGRGYLPLALAGSAYVGTHNIDKAILAYMLTHAGTDPAVGTYIGRMLQNPALLGSLKGLPANATRAGVGLYETGRKPQQ